MPLTPPPPPPTSTKTPLNPSLEKNDLRIKHVPSSKHKTTSLSMETNKTKDNSTTKTVGSYG